MADAPRAHDHGSGPRGHGHGHAHTPKDFGRAFFLGAILNIGFVVVEAVFGFVSGSMALLADAGHNLSDVFSLLLAWGAAVAARRAPSTRFTYGLRSSSILAALANAVLLLVAVGAIVLEAVQRLVHPVAVESVTVMAVAAVGIVINTATAMMFVRGQGDDLNVRGAFLHMAGDAAVSLAVLLGGLAIWLTGRAWIDPALSLIVAGVIVWSTWSLLRESVLLAMDAVPAGIDPVAVRAYLAGLSGVASVHDLHIWPMSTTETALTCHLVMPGGHPGDEFLTQVGHDLAHRFHIQHPTLQVETAGGSCALAPDQVV